MAAARPSDYSHPIKTYEYGGYRFEMPKMSDIAITLVPQPYVVPMLTYHSRVVNTLHTVWDLEEFHFPRSPVKIGKLTDSSAFARPVARILDMPIKLAGSNDYKIPSNLAPFRSTIQMIIDHEHSILREGQLLAYNAYLTIDQSFVHRGETQRKPGLHVDGFQGARVFPKTLVNHSYVVSNCTPTVFYVQQFNFDRLDERVHNFFHEMDAQADESKTLRTEPLSVYLMDAYTVHRAEVAEDEGFRTFFRISFDVHKFDRLGDTITPVLPYKWDMVPREAQTSLITYQPLTQIETWMLSPAHSDALADYLATLKIRNVNRYYNMIFAALQSADTIFILALKSLLNTTQPTMQELRLLFVSATVPALDLAQIGLYGLAHHLLIAKRHLEKHLLLEFVIEMMTQKPGLMANVLLREVVRGNEETIQGRAILQQLIPEASSNPACFWQNSRERHDSEIQAAKFRARL